MSDSTRATGDQDARPPSTKRLGDDRTWDDTLVHNGANASIVIDDATVRETPWTPKSLGRAKTAIVYKQTLNDTLLVLERGFFFTSGWVPYFVSLQEDSILMFTTRERWEQGYKPDKVIELHDRLLLGEMHVEVVGRYSSTDGTDGTSRLFHRKLLELDHVHEVHEEHPHGVIDSTRARVDTRAVDGARASTQCILEFGSKSQCTFELWTKAVRYVLAVQRAMQLHQQRSDESEEFDDGTDDDDSTEFVNGPKQCWVSPGQDLKVTLLRSELWCSRVLSGEKEKAASEIRRIVAMEKLVAQVDHSQMALLVYEKVSRVHELFAANSRREIEGVDARAAPLSAEVLRFFLDHLKRKYSVFLILALTYGVKDTEIRQAHERMCHENAAVHAGVGGGSGKQHQSVASCGFQDPESIELYEKYRDAAANYHRVNYGDTSAAEEEDAIMHLPVMLQVAVVRQDVDESSAMLSILNTVKTRLREHCCR
ncbi:unnamed protein product [Hyaloperonospora brassicae]|uniref:PH domain-containing protein n=1 Tax=Hyaloperonospora brassicae TaxID=162125 RepID=A0AAV0V7F7_HYABA|nr:unnamed protein product [Hyaloperonospora brassicae]